MKPINLKSFISSKFNLTPELFEKYLNFYSNKPIKESEFDDLKKLTGAIVKMKPLANVYDDYFIGYTIPRISKEFDLLRIGEEYIIDIEIKRTSPEEKIVYQIKQNRYYLSFLQKQLYIITYISLEDKFYTLNEDDELINISIVDVINLLENQVVNKVDINSLFNPTNYLVSPFNSTEQFAECEYFLTDEQSAVKTQVLKLLSNKPNIVSIKGKAGSGKSLLTYDIANHYIKSGVKHLVIHCGYLNDGHAKLISKYNWNIIPIVNLKYTDLSKYELVVIDETQRIKKYQLEKIKEQSIKHNYNIIFAYDAFQFLSNKEFLNKIETKIESEYQPKVFELTSKIRTNKDISEFIKGLFNKDAIIERQNYSNIEIKYFIDYRDALAHIQILRYKDWKVINYTQSLRDVLPYDKYHINEESDNAHKIIGQEFDNVIALIDDIFFYNSDKLAIRTDGNNYYYNPIKMLYQIVTRTRKKLNVIIINNPEVLERCLSMIKQD